MKKVLMVLMVSGLLGAVAIAPAVASECGAKTGYEKKAREMSEDFQGKIAQLREEAKELSGDARDEVKAKIDRAQKEWDRASQDYGRMKDEKDSGVAEEAWEKMKSAASSASDSAEQAYNDAAVYLGLKSSQTDAEAKAKLEKRIDDYMDGFKKKLQAAREKAKDLPEDSRAEGKKLVDTLREKWSQAEKELARMKDKGSEAGEEAWKEIKSGMNSAIEELNQAYQSVEDFIDGESS
ncbi:MAG: hypothetical protein P9M08_10315 [Candidatus Erginobacter occultus]|nr:hypothetical protein [Candidatus Erginobacter occultus]